MLYMYKMSLEIVFYDIFINIDFIQKHPNVVKRNEQVKLIDYFYQSIDLKTYCLMSYKINIIALCTDNHHVGTT